MRNHGSHVYREEPRSMMYGRTGTALGATILVALALAPATRGQTSPGTRMLVQMQDGTRHAGFTYGWGISPDTVQGPDGKKYDRPAVRIVCARGATGNDQRECDKTFPALPGTEDIVVWRDKSHTAGRIKGVGCNYDDCVITQNGSTRPWNDVDYVQLAPAAPAQK